MKDEVEEDDSGASIASTSTLGTYRSVASISGTSTSGVSSGASTPGASAWAPSTWGPCASGASTSGTSPWDPSTSAPSTSGVSAWEPCTPGQTTSGASTSGVPTWEPCEWDPSTSDPSTSGASISDASTSRASTSRASISGTSTSGTSKKPIKPYNSARASRNLAEKQRRDNLNANIAMMAAMVPAVAGSSRRQDKISILRLSAAYLRINYTLGQGNQGSVPSKFNSIDLEQICLDSCEGNGSFLLIVTTTGSIVHVGRNIEGPLGHLPTELMGKSLYNYVHPDDHDELSRGLAVSGAFPAVTDGSNHDQNSTSSDNSKRTAQRRRNFVIKIAQRTHSRGEHIQYKCFSISGVHRLADYCQKRPADREYPATNNDVIFVGIARLMHRRVTELSLFEATKEEYVTRHLVDGRIIFCDHRISIVAGYMSEEVSGANAFRYMHKDDVRWTMIGLRQMYDRREGFGSSCYRLLSKTGEFIYLRTHGYLEMDTKTGTFESFVCVNTLVKAEEGEKLIREMKDRYAATLHDMAGGLFDPEMLNPQAESAPSVEDPTQLEGVILQLISDLSAPIPVDGRISPGPAPDLQYAKAAMFSTRLPPASVQANHLGVKMIPRPGRSKSKQMKRTMSTASSTSSQGTENYEEPPHRTQAQASPSRQNGTHQIAEKIIPELPSPVVADILNSVELQQTNFHMQPVLSQDQHFYDPHQMSTNPSVLHPDVNSEMSYIETPEPGAGGSQYPQIDPSVDYYGQPESMGMFIKSEASTSAMDTPDEGFGKRPLEDDDSDESDKRQRQESDTEEDLIDNPTFQELMNSDSDIMRMLDAITHPLNPDKKSARADILHLVPEKVDETLRQTYAHLQDSIDYQGSQINELGLVFENSELHTRRQNFDQLQAEHEIQKKMIKTLQQDHHSMQVNVKQNVGV
ncbi:hypoxia-inducible factor 1-alpha isoform X2 [Diachasma alloeum]|uniref:hypoxia-inducible factor 1-alpha isoform X2 n=1 Tax=Diachasma alloeum TaxID=454923 RepID=UPI00073850DC|nr:hypoxia-inducible factor 1-alpha isoform X2 [Diachasma alloeum]